MCAHSLLSVTKILMSWSQKRDRQTIEQRDDNHTIDMDSWIHGRQERRQERTQLVVVVVGPKNERKDQDWMDVWERCRKEKRKNTLLMQDMSVSNDGQKEGWQGNILTDSRGRVNTSPALFYTRDSFLMTGWYTIECGIGLGVQIETNRTRTRSCISPTPLLS